jgi:hypothetical protein
MDTRITGPASAATDIAELKSRLANRADGLLVALLGEPTAKGARYWRWGRRGSLSYDFHLHHWHNFETETGGDLFDLIRSGNPGWGFREALDWACRWLGDRPTIARRRIPTPPEHARLQPTGARLAMQLWREGHSAKGSPVEAYLAERGLALPEHCEEVLRFHPACPRSDARLPAMLGLMRDIVTNRPAGVHRTFLRADGRAKAEIEPNRMMLGPAKGAVLKLSPDEEVTMGLALTEGIEDALALLSDARGPVWACLSAGAMSAFPVLGGIEALSVFADNDRAGARAADACVERWQRAGKDALVVTPPRRFKDFGAIAEGKRHG